MRNHPGKVSSADFNDPSGIELKLKGARPSLVWLFCVGQLNVVYLSQGIRTESIT